jgi:hypothetical protein
MGDNNSLVPSSGNPSQGSQEGSIFSGGIASGSNMDAIRNAATDDNTVPLVPVFLFARGSEFFYSWKRVKLQLDLAWYDDTMEKPRCDVDRSCGMFSDCCTTSKPASIGESVNLVSSRPNLFVIRSMYALAVVVQEQTSSSHRYVTRG